MRRDLALLTVVLLCASCGGAASGGVFEYPSAQVDQHDTAYLAVVVAAPDGDDLEHGAGEHVVVRNRWEHRADLGGWWIEDADGSRLPLGVGRQIDPGAELRVHSACGEDTVEAVFACLDEPVLDDDGDVLTLRDSGGNQVMRFTYGTTAR